jgi:hypothetical protein
MTDLLEQLKKLAYRKHYNCEDSWYSCPLSEDGCYNDAAGNECNCWARDNEKMEDLFNEIEKQYALSCSDQFDDHMNCFGSCIRCGVIDLKKEREFQAIGADISYNISDMSDMMADEIIKLNQLLKERD